VSSERSLLKRTFIPGNGTIETGDCCIRCEELVLCCGVWWAVGAVSEGVGVAGVGVAVSSRFIRGSEAGGFCVVAGAGTHG
jgi:hypothetical protein